MFNITWINRHCCMVATYFNIFVTHARHIARNIRWTVMTVSVVAETLYACLRNTNVQHTTVHFIESFKYMSAIFESKLIITTLGVPMKISLLECISMLTTWSNITRLKVLCWNARRLRTADRLDSYRIYVILQYNYRMGRITRQPSVSMSKW